MSRYIDMTRYFNIRKIRTSLDVADEISQISTIISELQEEIEQLKYLTKIPRYLICSYYEQNIDKELEELQSDVDELLKFRERLYKERDRLFKKECVLKR